MLSKNYSTLAILMAANVVDGGKKFEEVPASIQQKLVNLSRQLRANLLDCR